MTEALRKILQNPFLKESPFRSNHNFYSAPKNYLSQSYSKSQTQNSFVNQSTSYGRQKQITQAFDRKSDNKALKKISNPFFRKNLLNRNKFQEDYVEFQPVCFLQISSKINKPNILNQGSYNTFNQNIYKDLSYNPSAQCQLKNLSHGLKHSGNYQNMDINLVSKRYLSPRFASAQMIQSNKQNDVFRSSVESPVNAYSPRNEGFNSKRGLFSSERKISPLYANENQPERDINYNIKYDRDKRISKQVSLPQDGYPKQIVIKGDRYYKNLIQTLKSK